ncbi:MAG: hypothetical protein ACFFCM_13830, partial [Promethearchaeota archaeon]
QYRQAFKSLKERDRITFLKNLQKVLFQSEIFYTYEFSKHYTIVLIDKIFIENNSISINYLFQSVRRLYNNTMNIIFFIQDYFSEEFDSTDFIMK